MKRATEKLFGASGKYAKMIFFETNEETKGGYDVYSVSFEILFAFYPVCDCSVEYREDESGCEEATQYHRVLCKLITLLRTIINFFLSIINIV